MPDVLLAYATRNGSTQQVAETVAASLREAGAQVTARSARAAREGSTTTTARAAARAGPPTGQSR